MSETFGSWPILLPTLAIGVVLGALWMRRRCQRMIDALKAGADHHFAQCLGNKVDEAIRAVEAELGKAA